MRGFEWDSCEFYKEPSESVCRTRSRKSLLSWKITKHGLAQSVQMFKVSRLAMPSWHMIAKELFLLERDFHINYANSCVNICSFVFAVNSLCTFYPWIPKKGRCHLPFLKQQRHKKTKQFCIVMYLFTGRARTRSRNRSSVGAELSQLPFSL